MKKCLRNLSHCLSAFKVFSRREGGALKKLFSKPIRSVIPFKDRLTLSFLDLLAPNFCRECDTPLPERNEPFCARCLEKVEWIDRACARCGLPVVNPPAIEPVSSPAADSPLEPSLEVRLRLPPHCGACARLGLSFDLASAGGKYTRSLRTAVLLYKFQRDLGVVPLLRKALLRAAASPSIAPLLEKVDAIVPVPLHPLKRCLRGWDPALELARILERDLASSHRIPALRLLKKTRWTPSQVSLPEEARRRNLRRAFRARAVKVPPVVVLVDDVLTTGTTLSECALVLKREGAQTVVALAIARS